MMNFTPDKGTSEHYVVPVGTYAARLYAVVDLGHQWTQYLNKPGKWSHQVYVGFEIPELTFEAEDKQNGAKTTKPRVIGRQFTLSYYKDSRLKALVQALIGREMTLQEQNVIGYPLETLVGSACLLSVTHSTVKKGTDTVTYANIESVMAVPKGMSVEEQFNPDMVYCIADDPDQTIYALLYKWLQDKIAKSQEFTAEPEAEEPPTDASLPESTDTSLPYTDDPITAEQKQQINDLFNSKKLTSSVFMKTYLEPLGVKKASDMTTDQAAAVIELLKAA